MATTKTRKQTEITSAAIFRSVAKKTFTEKCFTIEAGETFYRVNSDTENDSYIVRWSGKAHRLECSCKCGIESSHKKTCKHIRAASEICAARKEFHQEAATTAASICDVVAEAEQVAETAWVTMPDGTQRIPSQVNDECLDALSELAAEYREAQRRWEAMTIDERREAYCAVFDPDGINL